MGKIIVIGNSLVEVSISDQISRLNDGVVAFAPNLIRTVVSGIGLNVALSLRTLGNRPDFLTLIGQDQIGDLIYSFISKAGIPTELVTRSEEESGISIISYHAGKDPGMLLDLKKAHDDRSLSQLPPVNYSDYKLAICCFIGFSRPYLDGFSSAGIPIAADVQVLSDVNDPEKQAYLANAEILFLSNQAIRGKELAFIKELQKRYDNQIIGVGMGEEGSLLALRSTGDIWHIPAVFTRPVVNTIGCGDALFSSFLHGFLKSGNPLQAMERAAVYASYKAGSNGASAGFLTEAELDDWTKRTAINVKRITF
jgi:sugar/nucleoside kinase (ribokinase family)